MRWRGLLVVRHHTSGDHVVDLLRRHITAANQFLEGGPQQIGGMPGGQRPAALADRCPDGIDDHGLAGGAEATGLGGVGHDWVLPRGGRVVVAVSAWVVCAVAGRAWRTALSGMSWRAARSSQWAVGCALKARA